MASSSNRALAAVVAAFCLAATNVVQQAEAHPNCLGDFAPDLSADAQFCPDTNVDGFCCNGPQEASIQANYDLAGATGACADLYEEVVCGICHPWSGHLFERLGTAMTLTNSFCDEFYSECSGQLNLPSNYCDVHTGGDTDAFYSYPYVADDSFSGEGLIKPFPGVDGNLPTNPLDMRMTPDGSKWWVLGLEGEIVEFDAVNPSGVTQVMDIASKIRVTFEEGLLSLAFTPGFHTTGVFYVTYVANVGTSEFGSNRLSRFQYTPGNPSATAGSEQEIITTTPKGSEVHSAGWIGFKPSAYSSGNADGTHELYWAIGDAGPQLDLSNNGQSPDTLHGSINRIVVDSNMGSSYSVPSSNPFSGGGGKPEICSQGFRNPYKCSFDRDNDELYCGDVGHLRVETVKKVECGNNYGWRQFEGERCLLEVEGDFDVPCAEQSTSGFTLPIYSYCHPDYYPADEPSYLVPDNYCGDRSIVGNAVIGGFVYRGVKYADLLYGNYVFAEYQQQGLHNLYPTGSGYGYGTVKGSDFFKTAGFAEDNDGEIYLIAYKGDIYEMPCGDICDGENVNPVGLPEPVTPTIPSETPAPVAAVTDSPATPVPTKAPTPAPFTFAPLTPGETAAPSTASLTPAPFMTVTAAPTSATTPAPAITATPKPDPTTLAPIMIRTAAPTATPEPTAPRTASPERIDDDYVAAPVRTATEPPTAEKPVTPAPFAPVPVEPEDPVTPREPTAVPAPTAVPEPTVQAPTVPGGPIAESPTTPFVCDGLLSPLGQYCCPTGCGECGGVGCSSRPLGAENCCTTKIKASGDMCAVTQAAPCRIPVEDVPIPAPAPIAPEAPTTPDRIEPSSPKIPSTPGSAVPDVSREDFAYCDMEYGEDVVPMTGSENAVVSPPEYLGCFVDSPDDRLLNLAYNQSEAMTPTMCSSMCSAIGGDTFGLQNGYECWCGDSRDDEVGSYGRTDCDMPCSGDATVTCGGHDRLDAYYIGGGSKVPENSVYLGCYEDHQQGRALDASFVWCDGKMTVPLCEQFCRSKRAVVYGVQYGHECWCGDHMDYDQYGPGQCDYRCAGDMHTTCGGYTVSSVYSLHY